VVVAKVKALTPDLGVKATTTQMGDAVASEI